LGDNSRLLRDPEAHTDLIPELRYFAQLFEAMTRVLSEPLLDSIFGNLIFEELKLSQLTPATHTGEL
jgi:hypothetical protein